ncbi:MAG: hypothetical protein CL867_06420 [Cytophagaceae bacterium]|nr:hypothetical protein [Cytophagaceae bacterium]
MIKKVQHVLRKILRPSETYNFKTIDFDEISQYGDSIDALRGGKVDGFLIKNVLKDFEVDKLLMGYSKFHESEICHIYEGLSITPEPFSSVSQNNDDLLSYFNRAELFWEDFPISFDFDFVARMKKVFHSLSSNMSVEIPRGINEQGMFNPATFREMSPDIGELQVHCGNQFRSEFSSFYDHLEKKSNITNQLSYFVMLNPSESGGELTLYNLRWDHVKKKMSATTLRDLSGKLHDLTNKKSVKRLSVSPQKGDMILFCGGQIWHKVELVKGKENRITLGGFLTFAKNKNGLHFWS